MDLDWATETEDYKNQSKNKNLPSKYIGNHISYMHHIKFTLKHYLYFLFLMATACSSTQKNNLPPITNQNEEQKKNEEPSITIKSTGSGGVVCIGSYNTIHIGKIDQVTETHKGINPSKKTTPNNNKDITYQGPIQIEGTAPDGAVWIGSHNTITTYSGSSEANDKNQEQNQDKHGNNNNKNK